MRELKFRVWDIQFKRMKVTGIGINNGILFGDDVEIMQYIGLKDKNGKEIYEGDLLLIKNNPSIDNPSGDSDICPVVFHCGTFGWLDHGRFETFLGWYGRLKDGGQVNEETIGNIYENKEGICH